MKLKDKIDQDLKEALLRNQELQVSVLRLLINAIKNAEIELKKELTKEDLLKILQKQAKQREDSIEFFKKGGRQDLADKETKELQIIKGYLPKGLSEEEIKDLVKATIKELNVQSLQDLGQVMGSLMPKVAGRASGDVVSQIVKEELQNG